jgi:hypothetical protein
MQNTSLKTVAPDLVSFGIGISLAYFLHWQVKDIVWSLWLCSLVIGYTSILTIIYRFATANGTIGIGQDKPPLHLPSGLRWGLGMFLLCFFSIHFMGFHLVHGIFLNLFFPLAVETDLGMLEPFEILAELPSILFSTLLIPYGSFLVPALIAERKHIFGPSKARTGEASNDTKNDWNEAGLSMKRPYQNVVRMHLLIFFFAFCMIFQVEHFAVFVVIYAVYFFPWYILKRNTKGMEKV